MKIPFQTHAMIRKACRELFPVPRAKSLRQFLDGTVSQLPLRTVDNVGTIWYFKGTDVDMAFSGATGYVVFDHVRRERTTALKFIDAMKARDRILKELETYVPPEDDQGPIHGQREAVQADQTH